MHTATYFEKQNLLYVICARRLNFTSLTARMAEWTIEISAPNDRLTLVDLRQMESVDRLVDGIQEYVKLQNRLSLEYAPSRKLALVAGRPETFVAARSFEQAASETSSTDMEVFQDEAEALNFLGFAAQDLDQFIASLGSGRALG